MSETLAAVLSVFGYGALAVVVVLMVARRGPWRRRPDDVDWTTAAGCQRCDEHGPFLSDAEERGRDAHQAWHGLAVEALRPVGGVVGWISKRLA